MGEVYRADDLRIGQQVALKFLPASMAGDPGKLRRLYEEIRIGRQVSHPNVCRIYDIVEWDGHAFMTMEYIDGEDLASLLRRIGRLPYDKAVAVARDVAGGLAAAHALGVVHRDLKPANVMIDGRGTGRITDFGLAVLAEELGGRLVIEGTPAYMAPEQLAGEPVTPRTDIYAFGVTLYELFTGKRLFQGSSLDAIRSEHASRSSSLSTDSGAIDPSMQSVIARCIEETPSSRPSSMHAVIAAMPGGDPIQAALDAGETPSPEMLAAAGETGELKASQAWPLMVLTLLLIAATYGLLARVNLLSFVPLRESPEALAFRARDVMGKLVPASPAGDAFYRFSFETRDFSARMAAASTLEEALALRPPPARFYYRQSRGTMVAHGRSMMRSATDPPFNVPGMAELELDPEGRLLRATVVPPATSANRDADPDWTSLLAATGVFAGSLQTVQPERTPPVAMHRRYAWTASYEDRPDQHVRIEAASWDGSPVWLAVFPAWREAPSAVAAREGFAATAGAAIPLVLTLMVFAIAAVLARRNVVAQRADSRAAARLCLVVAVLTFVGRMLHSDHTTDVAGEFSVIIDALMMSLYYGALTWAFYVAIEPYLRRRWPRAMIAWKRAIDGRFTDPLVAREVLVGVITAMAVTSASAALMLLARASGDQTAPNAPAPSVIEGPAHFFEYFTALTVTSITAAAGCAILLLVTHVVLGKRLVSVVVAAIPMGVLLFPPIPAAGGWVPLTGQAMLAAAAATLLARRGILSLIVALLTVNLMAWGPLTLDTSVWFFWRSLAPILLLSAATVWAFVNSLGSQPLFSNAVLEE